MSKYSVVWRLSVIALALVALALFGLYWYYAGVVSQTVAAGVFGVSLTLQIVGYSLPVGALLAAGLLGYGAIFTVYHRVKLQQVEVLHRLAEAESVGLTVHSVSSKKSAVIVSPGRQPVMLVHPQEGAMALPPTGDEPLPCLVEVMTGLDRILLVGGTGSGKTNLLKHYVTRLAGNGNRLTVIDPHSPSKLCGIDVIGAGLDFSSIESKMIEIMLDVSKRYASGNIAGDGNLGRDNEFLIIEEFLDIHSQIPEVAEEFLRIMLVRGRKAGKKFCLVTQNDSVSSLGIKGDSGLLTGAERVEIRRDIRTGSRVGFVGRKVSDRVECLVPGLFNQPFADVPPRQLVIEQSKLAGMTDSQKQLALTVARLNGQAGSTSRNEIYRLAGVGKNGQTAEFLEGLLNRSNW